MTSQEALDKVARYCSDMRTIGKAREKLTCELDIILQDLDRLEVLEKVIEIIKNKKVNIYHIWVFDNYNQYVEHYPFAEYHAKKDMLNIEEFNFLKEVLKNDC